MENRWSRRRPCARLAPSRRFAGRSRARASTPNSFARRPSPCISCSRALACFAEIEQTFRAQFECVAGRLRQFDEQLAARQAEIAQHGRGAARVLGCAAPRKQPAPAHELRIKPRLNVKRAPRTRHPFQSLPDHPRRGDRREMTRRDVAGAPVRTRIGALGVALNHRDRKPLRARDSARCKGRRCRRRKRSRSANRSS